MKYYVAQDGGRELLHDDLQLLDSEARAATTALCAATGQGALIVSGCRLTQTGPTVRIASGLVYLGSYGLVRLAATSGLTLPIEIVAAPAPVASDERRYEDGSKKPGWAEMLAVAQPASALIAAKILITDLGGGLTYAQALAAAARPLGQLEWLAVYDAAQYDASGRGLGRARGWALCNGQNDTVDLRGRVTMAVTDGLITVSNTAAGQLDCTTVGSTGGASSVALSTNEIPSHRHPVVTGQNYLGTGGSSQVGRGSAAYSATHQTEPAGGGQAHENRQPFMVLLARQWIGL